MNRSEARAVRLRRIAAVEIRRHREKQGLRGAALDGSLATGALWPTSDLDFMVVLTGADAERGVEWGQREGIVWHKHLAGRRVLLDLVAGYPESFIAPASGKFSLDANWFLDGLAEMEVVEDPEGLLAKTKAFVAARRFAPVVWEGRREALLRELQRQLDVAREALALGDAEKAYDQLSRSTGLAVVAGQLWLEAARRSVSSKEQDGCLAELTRAAGRPEVHALYRAVSGVQPGRAEAAAPLVRELGECGVTFVRQLQPGDPSYQTWHGSPAVRAAWIRHLTGKLALAPFKGHPAHLYQERWKLLYWTVRSPGEIAREMRAQVAPVREAIEAVAAQAERLAVKLDAALFGAMPAAERARAALAAAERLVELTARAV